MLNRSALAAECVGTAFLLTAVVGSGIMAAQLSEDVGLQLLQNAFATAAALVALILAFGGASGAHFNPAVTLAARHYSAIVVVWSQGIHTYASAPAAPNLRKKC